MISFKYFKLLVAALLMVAGSAFANVADFEPLTIAYKQIPGGDLWAILSARMEAVPFNFVATLLFVCAILHTFLAPKIQHWAHLLRERHKHFMATGKRPVGSVSLRAECLHFLGEVEAIFGIWAIPLLGAIAFYYDWHSVCNYVDHYVNYTEPVFVVIVMAIASSRPILKLAESGMKWVALLGKSTPAAWWFSILTLAPLFSSVITEPAAMTIGAMLLSKQFYELKPSLALKYATMGLLFVNVSVGGTLTHFAAPPVLMVAGKWGWDTPFMFLNFGWRAVVGIVVANALYYFFFRREFSRLKSLTVSEARSEKVPFWVVATHLFFLLWTIFNLHNVPLFLGGFLFFMAFLHTTTHHQEKMRLRSPVLVGFFLAGLVTHGTLQQWWLEPVLTQLKEFQLFLGATFLTSFNDNAAITFLASLVSDFANNPIMQRAVVAGAVTGGGLTVIANAPNPAGQSILSKHFKDGVSPLYLFLGALIPTIIVGTALYI
ncbi:MAG: hypothetical protein A2Y14_02295 [Verrucomicrobia bacterium GWF2_51_19]|nr:MAG: hypothetical protein A2Y14_02295 [Verrucomicrobia bacterium GWF2_51_19]HCJ11914.1 hypothetical protein [Opitutae bacterium]